MRTGEQLALDNTPFYFIGANAYYLMESAARGDTATVSALFSQAQELGFTVIRTWGFFDSEDSLDPAVIQRAPGVYNEYALQALDYVLLGAQRTGIKLLIPLVNNWDDYGGMNQYARWRESVNVGLGKVSDRYSTEERAMQVSGSRGQKYRIAVGSAFGHDDFYSDPMMKGWYRDYVQTILERTNTLTGIQYKNDPAILGWELANEPRSSERTGSLVHSWVEEMSGFIKQIDPNHLVGTGEEGFEVSPQGYSLGVYPTDLWIFDGSAGVSFTANSSLSTIDIASTHVYPEAWSLPWAAGSAWISEHIRRSTVLGKPLVVGEFGTREFKESSYDSWLTTANLEDAAGALVWQMLEGARNDNDGFGIRCWEDSGVCAVLERFASVFSDKSRGIIQPIPVAVQLHQNYPNPFNGQTTISYDLPFEGYVHLFLFNTIGQCVLKLVNGEQRSGVRKELLDALLLPSGVYIYRLEVVDQSNQRQAMADRKLILIK